MIDITLLYIAVCIFLYIHNISYDGGTQCEIAQLILLLEMLLCSTKCYKMVGLCYYQEKGVSGRPKHSKTNLPIVHFLEPNLETV